MHYIIAFIIVALIAVVHSDGEVTVHKFDLKDRMESLSYLTDQIVMIKASSNHHISLNGGETFDPIDSAVCKSAGCIKSYDVSPLQPKTISFRTKDGIYLCEDITKFGSDNCGKLTIPAHPSARIIQFAFHPSDRARALMLVNVNDLGEDVKTEDDDKEHRLYVTSNLMKSNPTDVRWEHVMSHTISATWGDLRAKKFNSDTVYGIRVQHHKSLLPVSEVKSFYSINLGDRHRVPKDLVQHAETFMRKDKFLFVATSDSKKNVRLHVSEDNAYTFREAEFSPAKKQMSYTLLDASEGSVFINVFHDDNEPKGASWGNVYQSDSTGSRFSLSLDHNKRAGAHASFQKVESLEGVYIANMVANYDDEACRNCGDYYQCVEVCKYVSRITFNKGAEWHPIPAPGFTMNDVGSNKKSHLHLHGFASSSHVPLYSRKNAIGMIIATGNVGEELLNDISETNTYISRDGGLTWKELAPVSMLYASSHHGGLIVSSTPAIPVSQLDYSFTQGPPFMQFNLSGSYNIQHIIHNDKDELSKKFIVVGQEKVHEHPTPHSIIMVVSFESLHKRECIPMGKDDTDYEYFRPRSYDSSCLLGRKIEYVRRKETSACFNPVGYEKPHKRENCQCSYSDYMCDFGYMKRPKLGLSLDAFECVPVGKAAPDTKPPYPCEGVYNETRGYARVPGDSCVDGLSAQLDPILRSCPGGIGLLGSAVLLMFIALLISFAGVLLYKNNPLIRDWLKSTFSSSAQLANRGYDPVQTHDQFSSDDDDNDFDESVFANEPVETVTPRRHVQDQIVVTRSSPAQQSNIFPDADSISSDDPLARSHLTVGADTSSQGEEEDTHQSNIVHLNAGGQS